MDLRMACLSRAKRSLSATLDVLQDADAKVAYRGHRLIDALPQLRDCDDVDALTSETPAPPSAELTRVDEIRTTLTQSNVDRAAGHHESALANASAAREAAAELTYQPIFAEIAMAEGSALEAGGKYQEAEKLLKEALRLGVKTGQWSVLHRAANLLMLVVGNRLGRFDEGLRYLELAEGAARGDQEKLLSTRRMHGILLVGHGQHQAAEATLRDVVEGYDALLGADSLKGAYAAEDLAGALFGRARYGKAEQIHRKSIRLLAAALGPAHPNVAQSRHNLASALWAQGKYQDSELESRRALDALQQAFGVEHRVVIAARTNLARALHYQGQLNRAVDEYQHALERALRVFDVHHPDVAMIRDNLANVYDDLERFEESESLHRQALASRQKTLGPNHPDIVQSLNNLGNLLSEQDRHAEAVRYLQEAVTMAEQVFDPEHPTLAEVRKNLELARQRHVSLTGPPRQGAPGAP